MVNKSTNSQQFPKLSSRDQQAVKVLTEEGLLEPLVMSLKNSTEAVQPQSTTQASEIKIRPNEGGSDQKRFFTRGSRSLAANELNTFSQFCSFF